MMQMVIDIDEEYYKAIINYGTNTLLERAVKNGTPLPKGHGRLIDGDVVLSAIDTWDKFGYTETGCFVRNPKNEYVPYVHYEDIVKSIRYASTIIEADKEQEYRTDIKGG